LADEPQAGHAWWGRIGAVLMVIGLLVGVGAFIRAASVVDPLAQRDSLALGLAAVALCIVGAAIYVKGALTNVLRFWAARISFDLRQPQGPERPRRAPADDGPLDPNDPIFDETN
jgi:hypothetical protein